MKKIFPLILIFTLTICCCSKKSKQESIIIKDTDTLITTYTEVPSIKDPSLQEPINNIFISLNVLKQASYYESSSKGEAVAKKGKLKLATQKIKNRRTITPNATFSESISTSTFVKVAEQLYITENTILKRKASKIKSNSVSWKDSVSKLTPAEHLKEYGYSAKDPSRYIINEESIISDIEIINAESETFTYKFNLNPQISTYYYKTSVKKLSDSKSYPKFKSIEMKITFNNKWEISQIDTYEIYEIEITGLGKVTCYATLSETFKNINEEIFIDEQSFFESKL